MGNQTVLVTGSSRGIGRAVAEKYAENNYNVVLNCLHNEEDMQKTVHGLRRTNQNVIGLRADVSDYAAVVDMAKKIDDTFGGVDILINNAGIAHIGLFTDMRPDDWQAVINANLISVFNCCHVFAPAMISWKRGVITNISSVWGGVGASCEAVYAASKGGLNAFTKSLAKELAPCDIRVNAIACGVIETQMNDWLSEHEKEDLNTQIPMGRFGKAADVADVAYFLSSQAAAYVTGEVIRVDGGL